MGEVGVPVVLVFVANHGKYLCYSMFDTFDAAAVAVGVVGAYREFVIPMVL